MNKLITIIAIILSVLPSIQAQKIAYERSGEVKCTRYDQNTIWVVSTGRADKIQYATAYAEVNAIENVLFKGIPNSGQESPIIENEMKAVKANEGFFRELLDNGDFRRFVMESVLLHKSKKKGVHTADVSMRIDLQALRKHLEQNKIIRKFGL